MPRTNSDKTRRANYILEQLSERDHITVGALSAALAVSPVTIRKDLKELEANGLLRRTHGGAIPVGGRTPNLMSASQTFAESAKHQQAAKRAIARVAATFVQPRDTLAFTGGTTATEVARQLQVVPNLTVITNAINIALEVSGYPAVTVFVPGGFLRGGMYSLVSVSALDRIRNFNIDTMFVGLNGIHPDHGLTELLNDQAIIHKTLMERSRRLIAVADHTKLGQVYRAFMCPVAALAALVTDDAANPHFVAQVRERGVEVHLAHPEAD